MHARAHTSCVTTARGLWSRFPARPPTSPRTPQVWGGAGAEAALGLGHGPPLSSPGPEAGSEGRRPRGRAGCQGTGVVPPVRSLPVSAHAHPRTEESAPLISLLGPLHGRAPLLRQLPPLVAAQPPSPSPRSGAPQSPVQEGSWLSPARSGCRRGCHEGQLKAFPKPRTGRVCPSNTS